MDIIRTRHTSPHGYVFEVMKFEIADEKLYMISIGYPGVYVPIDKRKYKELLSELDLEEQEREVW